MVIRTTKQRRMKPMKFNSVSADETSSKARLKQAIAMIKQIAIRNILEVDFINSFI